MHLGHLQPDSNRLDNGNLGANPTGDAVIHNVDHHRLPNGAFGQAQGELQILWSLALRNLRAIYFLLTKPGIIKLRHYGLPLVSWTHQGQPTRAVFQPPSRYSPTVARFYSLYWLVDCQRPHFSPIVVGRTSSLLLPLLQSPVLPWTVVWILVLQILNMQYQSNILNKAMQSAVSIKCIKVVVVEYNDD